MNECITYIGLDVHKETIAVALAEGIERGEVYSHGQIANTPAALTRLSSKLSRNGSVLRFCYEAGPCGYQHCGEQHLHRYIAEFDFRYSHRAALDVDDTARANAILKGAEGKRLTYRRLDAGLA